jgi:hypothetical protein
MFLVSKKNLEPLPFGASGKYHQKRILIEKVTGPQSKVKGVKNSKKQAFECYTANS